MLIILLIDDVKVYIAEIHNKNIHILARIVFEQLFYQLILIVLMNSTEIFKSLDKFFWNDLQSLYLSFNLDVHKDKFALLEHVWYGLPVTVPDLKYVLELAWLKWLWTMLVETVDLLFELVNNKILFNSKKIIKHCFLIFSYGSGGCFLLVHIDNELIEVVNQVKPKEFL